MAETNGLIPTAEELLFLPLGGSGEIGMNLNLYGHDGKWLMIDLGITFGDDTTPGIDILMPDPAFIESQKDNLIALVLTHAHEDHLGAVPYLWEKLQCPIYASPFAAAFLERKLNEAGLAGRVPVHVVPLSGQVTLGPFDIEFISLTHSIPEPNALALRTPLGTVLHTGDWKLDPEPLVGQKTDEDALIALGDEGVLAMVCDSTNVLNPDHSGSEDDVRKSLMTLVGEFESRVAIACFASNVARLETAALVAAAHDRHAVLVGRSLHRMYDCAKEAGYLRNIPAFIDEREAGYLPRNKVLYICTGSQGEPRAALSRIARDDHPHVTLEEGDAVIFSSRIIPGNERAIGRLHNQLSCLGVDIVTDRDHFTHVSGHPGQEELAQFYQWVRPSILVPVHGEDRHLEFHAKFGLECQIPTTVSIRNGDVLRLAPGAAEIVDEVETGKLAADGGRLIRERGALWRERQKMLMNGNAAVSLVLDEDGFLLSDPIVSSHGLFDPEFPDESNMVRQELIKAIREAVDQLPEGTRIRDDVAIEEHVRRAARRRFNLAWGKKPLIDVAIHRVD